ncbi:MAG: hypothetical protein ACFFBD_00480 [Candidatus Hodarchaeota archaeon]
MGWKRKITPREKKPPESPRKRYVPLTLVGTRKGLLCYRDKSDRLNGGQISDSLQFAIHSALITLLEDINGLDIQKPILVENKYLICIFVRENWIFIFQGLVKHKSFLLQYGKRFVKGFEDRKKSSGGKEANEGN